MREKWYEEEYEVKGVKKVVGFSLFDVVVGEEELLISLCSGEGVRIGWDDLIEELRKRKKLKS